MRSRQKSYINNTGGEKGFRQMAELKEPGLVVEFLDFLQQNKKWWLSPIIVMLLILGLLAILSGTGAAPFIYTLF